jgi:hypothetical protein
LSDVERRENDDTFTGTPWADRWVDIGSSQSPLVARKVRVVQLSPAPVVEQKSVPMGSPYHVIVPAFIVFVLMLGTIGALYRRDP